jgi:shikimate kinase
MEISQIRAKPRNNKWRMTKSQIMKIYLIGFMGSGKSYVGTRLAAELSFDFLDLDAIIETAENQTIATIFEEKGEDYFRSIESFYLKNIKHNKNIVISTGGGTPCFFDNMDWMNDHGTTIFLNPTVDILYQRLQSETTKRPLLGDNSEETLRLFISQKLENRLKYYEKAQHIINIATFGQNIIQEITNEL